MKLITIAVLTCYDHVFADLKDAEGDVKYIRISRIEDVRGRRFDGYCVLGSLYNIKNGYELLAAIKNRIKEKV